MKTLSQFRLSCVLAIFCLATVIVASAQLTTLHSFSGSDGGNPAVGLIRASDGNFYGTATGGGTHGGGTAFKITPSGTLSTLYNFGSVGNCGDGCDPMQMIQGRDGNFYGVTVNGGNMIYGEWSGLSFKLTPSGTETMLADFCWPAGNGCGFGPPIGSNPGSIIQASDGNFYGVTANGGDGDGGALWKLVPNSWALSVLFNFDVQSTGLFPGVSLTQGTDGQLYGVTPNGGTGLPNCSWYCGTIFKVTLSGTETVLYNFCSQANCADGATPAARLVQGSDGNFYGSTYAGGANGAGVIFKITPSGTYTVLHNLSSSDGAAVLGSMIQGSDGNFYGTGSVGGTHNYGTLFQVTPSGALTVLHSFNSSDGATPTGAIVQDSQGNFYGTTLNGGANGDGTAYKFQLTSYALSVTTTGNGAVTTTDGFINCPGTCAHNYPDNSQVTLNATPGTGWAFSGWGGACSGTGSCQLTITQNTSVSAAFYQLPVTLTISLSGSGAVTSNDGFIDCPGTCTHIYDPGSQVTLSASASSGWNFSGWSGACSGVGNCQLTMLGNYGVSAYFVEPGHGLGFVPVAPCRLVDTRQTGIPIQGGTSQNFDVPQLGGCGIPAGVAAYSINVTVAPRGRLGYLTVWPAGLAMPVISTLNSDGRTKAVAAIVQAGTSDSISVYASQTTDLILDINGYFKSTTGQTLQFYPLTPCRVIDTRNANSSLGGPALVGRAERDFPVLESSCIPQNASIQAYSFNITVSPNPSTQSMSYLTVWPQGTARPTVSTLNNYTGTRVANAAIVPAGDNGEIAVYPSQSTDLIVDINGYFAPAGHDGFSLYPTAPCRLLDTRNGNGAFSGELTVAVEGSVCAPSSTAQAYVFNATVVPTHQLGYLTLWPDGDTMPVASTLNASDGAITSNMAIIPTGNGKVDAYAPQPTQLILDLSSFFAP